MNSAISRLMDRYGLDYDEAHYFHDQLWMHTHGIASMVATDFCQWDMDKVERMVEECHALLSRKVPGRISYDVFQPGFEKPDFFPCS